MSDLSVKITSFVDWMDQATGDWVLLNPKDLPSMARFATELEQKAKDWNSTPELSALSETPSKGLLHASTLVKNVILGKTNNPAASMEEAGKVLQETCAGFRQLVQFSENSPSASLPPKTASSGPDATFTAVVDDSIVAAYVEQELSILPEMEQLVLAFEKERDANILPGLRRMIHTLKGESGAVGAMEIERVSHRFEDLLGGPPEAIVSDALFAALDWISRAIDAFGHGIPIEGADQLIELFKNPSLSPASSRPPAPPTPPPTPPGPKPQSAFLDTSIKISDIELANDFIAEAQEHFDMADEHLLILEKNPAAFDSIGAVFRSFHTLKGVAGFLGLTPIGELAHAAETILDEIRKGQRSFSDAAVELTFGALDLLKLMMNDLRDSLHRDGIMKVRAELPGLIQKLHALQATPAAPAATPLPPPAPVSPVTPLPPPPPPPHAMPAAADPARTVISPPPPPPSEPEPESDGGETIPQVHSVHTPTQTMKVDAYRIDQLLDMIGELVIIESIVAGDPEIRAINSLRIEKNLALLGKITRSLRDTGMSMRMVPVDPVFKKMARLVRDLARKSGKQVELIIKGGDTEIDKGMVEKLGDPLVHMIRNSMDHGIEPAEERIALGKPAQGHIELRAHHVGGNIHIDIEDDGRGLNREAIVQRGIERGLIPSAEGMSDQDIYALIFQPGFSTAKQITEISGRGVGMDVVKRNIESLRGNVLIHTTPGQGSLFTLALPLTTAIIDGMLVRVAQETYIMPTLSILESFRPEPGQVHAVTGRGEMVSFRGNLLPLFRLSRLLGASNAEADPLKSIVIVAEEYGKQWGLMVDDLLGQQQIVIKSLGEGLGQTAGVVGASILADGHPGLILDVADVIRLAKSE